MQRDVCVFSNVDFDENLFQSVGHDLVPPSGNGLRSGVHVHESAPVRGTPVLGCESALYETYLVDVSYALEIVLVIEDVPFDGHRRHHHRLRYCGSASFRGLEGCL